MNCTIKPIIIYTLTLLMWSVCFSFNSFSSEFYLGNATEDLSCIEQAALISSSSNQHQGQTDAPLHIAIIEDAKEEKQTFFEIIPCTLFKLYNADIQVENYFTHLHINEKQSLFFPVIAYQPECYILYHQLKSDLV